MSSAAKRSRSRRAIGGAVDYALLAESVDAAPPAPAQTVDPETWLAEKLKACGVDIYAGGTFGRFRERLRWAISNSPGIADRIIGRRAGNPETFRDCFERLYGEALDVPRGTVSPAIRNQPNFGGQS